MAVLLVALAALVFDSSWFSVDGFSNPTSIHRLVSSSRNGKTTKLFAEAPQYQKFEGILQQAKCVGKGNYLLTIDYKDPVDGGKTKIEDYPEYEAGHVLALEIQPPCDDGKEEGESAESRDSLISSRMTTMTEKTKKDLENNDGWLRGPYTVSFGYGSNNGNQQSNNGFKILIKEVGYKSHVFATSKPGTPVLFGGKFKVPIAEGIRSAAEKITDENCGETKRVVLVSSGVGVGPCIGAVEELLASSSNSESIISIDLIASYRTLEEVSMPSTLETLQKKFKDGDDNCKKPNFHWKSIITSEEGRLSSKSPESLRDYLRSPSVINEKTNISALTNTHYHIIGNGQLVTEWKEGLAKAGVPSSRVTVEAYFNHSAKPDPSAIENIYEAVLKLENDNQATETSLEAAVSP